MIPDDAFIFNRQLVARQFDDFEVRLQHALGQDAVPTLAGGRHMLYTCPICKCPWYHAGRREYARLTPEQLSHVSAVFHVDMHIRSALPEKLCPICSTVHLGGIFSVEEYRPEAALRHRGYRFLWENASPPYASLLAIIVPSVHMSISELIQLEPDIRTSSVQEVHAVLQWIETRSCPTMARVFSGDERRLLAYHLPHAHPGSQEVHEWQGFAWKDICSPPGCAATIALAIATPSCAMPSCERLLDGWRFVARAMRVVL